VAALAISLSVIYAVALYAVGELTLRRRSGTRGWARAANATERGANLLVLLAWLLGLLGPALVLAGKLDPFGPLDGVVGHVIGVLTCTWGLAFGIVAQRGMGEAWRTGIDPGRPSELVATGLYLVVRNPVYTSMIALSIGLLLLVPTPATALGLALCVLGVQIQTRRVEEPHLQALHGERYADYAARVGRFVPEIGLLGEKRPRETSA
jgi:protein-S-isoprenylcysteine O-methyltransferase Ste14